MHDEYWRQYIQIHNHAKTLFLLAEELESQNHKLRFQPIKEQRDALDHLVRAKAMELGIIEEKGVDAGEYVASQFRKAIAHTYRAFFDTADWLGIIIREAIQDTLDPYDHDCIDAVIPDYYSTYRRRIDEISEEIGELRNSKDIAKDGKSLVDDVETYRGAIDELAKIKEHIANTIPSLVDYSKRERRKNWRSNVKPALWIAVLGVIVAYILSLFNSIPPSTPP